MRCRSLWCGRAFCFNYPHIRYRSSPWVLCSIVQNSSPSITLSSSDRKMPWIDSFKPPKKQRSQFLTTPATIKWGGKNSRSTFNSFEHPLCQSRIKQINWPHSRRTYWFLVSDSNQKNQSTSWWIVRQPSARLIDFLPIHQSSKGRRRL